MVFLLVKQVFSSPCAGPEAGLFPRNQCAQPAPPSPVPGAPRTPVGGRGALVLFQRGGSTAWLDALGGSLNVWKVRGATLPLPGTPQEHSPLPAGAPTALAPPTNSHLEALKHILREAASWCHGKVTLVVQEITRCSA